MSTPEPISDERLKEATGRSRRSWFKLLDEVGAREWDHARIARWLGGKHDVDAWWAQSVTVDYERARGLRKVGEHKDGSFQTQASKTIRASRDEVWPKIDDDDIRREWLDLELEPRGRTPLKTLRLDVPDGSKVTIRLDDVATGVRVQVQHTKLAKEVMLAETKAFWKSALEQLAALIG